MDIACRLRLLVVSTTILCLLLASQPQAQAASSGAASTLQNECVLNARELRVVSTQLGNVPATLRIPPHVSRPPIVLWHGFGSPASESELMSRLPLDDVPAIKVYLGLPLFGARAPAGGTDELVRRQKEDVARLVFEPVVWGAVDELPAVVAALARHRCMKSGDKIGLFGFSAGGTAALISLAEHKVRVSSAVALNPSTGLTASVHAFEHATGRAYAWTDASRRLARRSDVAGRAADVAADRQAPALLIIAGEADNTIAAQDLDGLKNALSAHYSAVGAADRFAYVVMAGLKHNLVGSESEQDLQARLAGWFNRFK